MLVCDGEEEGYLCGTTTSQLQTRKSAGSEKFGDGLGVYTLNLY